MNICIIPARGGSKRIPRKNIKDFCGKPMIVWSIDAAINSKLFDKVIVSTDDKEISEVAIKHGAEIPFIRPEELSNDFTGTTPVIKHAIAELEGQGIVTTNVCCLYATAPFVQISDLKDGFKLLNDSKELDFAFSVTSFDFPIQRAVKITDDNRIQMFQPENFGTRSQDLEKAFHDAGQFYWGKSQAWIEERIIFGQRSAPIVLPSYRVQDIDTIEDWKRAEIIFKMLNSED